MSVIVNNRTLAGIVSFDDGNGGLLENGQLTASHVATDSAASDQLQVNELDADIIAVNELALNESLLVNSVEISPTWLSYLQGLTSNVQEQLNAVGSTLLSLSNVWTGATNTFQNNVIVRTSLSSSLPYGGSSIGAIFGGDSPYRAMTFSNISSTLFAPALPAFDFTRYTGSHVSLFSINYDGSVTAGEIDSPTIDDINNELTSKQNLITPGSRLNANLVGTGVVNNTEFSYLDGVTGSIQTQLNAKAPIASPTFTGTVSGVTKAMVGLGNVDNTSDANKPVSTAQQAALDLKVNSAGGALNGGSLDMAYLKNAGGATPAMPGNHFGCITSNFSSGLGEVDLIAKQHNYPNGDACRIYTENASAGTDLLMRLRKNGDVDFSGTITSPTITTINADIATKANSANPTFTGTATFDEIDVDNINGTSSTLQFYDGLARVENDGSILGKGFTDNTGTNTLDNNGLYCNNATVLNNLLLHFSVGRICRACFHLKCDGGAYYLPFVRNLKAFPGKLPTITNTQYLDKISTGVIQFIVDKDASGGLDDTSFMVTTSGTFDDGIVGDSNLLIGVTQKSAFSDGGSVIGYSFKLVITRAYAPGTRLDLASSGSIDCMIFW